ncbi:hypothetical protein P4O66_016676 [Electrophorus voltai]|uniref:Uncharacterized protein n=1 Tax=Electrophorus voltai TaxID=2609070 RepID=A0AAD8YVP5_9TELE|nr:hypothetical protein P4O66_016676 [Electrophorus voltai]
MEVPTAAFSFEHEEQPFGRNALASEANLNYLRSVNSESSSFIMVQPKSRMEAPSKLWMTMIVIVMIILQVASTAGLLVYLNMSMAHARSQGVSEELRCLGLLNALEKEQDVPDGLVQLFGEPCIKLAEGIKAYISKKDKQQASHVQNFSLLGTHGLLLTSPSETVDYRVCV